MKKHQIATGLLCTTCLAAGWWPAAAQAGTRSGPMAADSVVAIYARAVSACDKAMVAYWAPSDAPVEIYRSRNGGSWERQLRRPNPRFETVRGAVQYKIILGDQEAMTETIVTYRCRGAATR